MEKIKEILEDFFEITEDEKLYNCCYAGTHTTRDIVVKEKRERQLSKIFTCGTVRRKRI